MHENNLVDRIGMVSGHNHVDGTPTNNEQRSRTALELGKRNQQDSAILNQRRINSAWVR
jgi:hypothetical protein